MVKVSDHECVCVCICACLCVCLSDLLKVLLRVDEADVLGTLVRGRLAHATEALSSRIVVGVVAAGDLLPPAVNGHGGAPHAAPTPGLSYANKTPVAPSPAPATASGCEFDTVEDAVRDLGTLL
jgi:hypothetical protein